MSRLVKAEVLAARAELAAPPTPRACEDRTFELPPAIHIAMAGLFVGFVSVLCLALAHPLLAIPWAVFVSFIAAFFAVPALWARMAPEQNRSRALGWSEFMERGIAIDHGRCSGSEATVLVLMLPAFICLWAVSIAVIVALV